jgi:dipeptidyl aminopeptidase/acylaminoacyl peptidase
MRAVLLLAAVSGLALSQQAPQSLPPTEVFLMALPASSGLQSFRVPLPDSSTWINISNSPGYDNEPAFVLDSGAVLFTSSRDGRQTDIYRYDILAQRLTQLTETPESESWPAITPDGNHLSVVRVEEDGTRRLWWFDPDGTRPKVVLPAVKPVSHYAWIDARRVAVLVPPTGVDSATTFLIADSVTGSTDVIAKGVGRPFLLRPKTQTITYMQTSAPSTVKEYDPSMSSTRVLFPPYQDTLDAVWTADGRWLLKASGTVITLLDPAVAERAGAARTNPEPAAASRFGPVLVLNLFRHVMDDRSPRISSISRLAVSPDGRWLAFAAELHAK